MSVLIHPTITSSRLSVQIDALDADLVHRGFCNDCGELQMIVYPQEIQGKCDKCERYAVYHLAHFAPFVFN